ncbi:MAG: cation diffusion facilitator family transporter [Desulfovibrionaceae bacterium]|nr:cation diffusion facilitator family transporter [Desulfovibrionaceae bacterium]
MSQVTETADTAEKLKARAALLSLVAAVFLTSLKLAIGLYTNSLAILSEALHSGLDLLAALMTWYAIRVSARPADRRHPYGHGKVENLSALAETVLLFVVCGYVGWEGAHRLMEGASPVLPSLWGVGCMLVSMAIDINRVRTLRRVARETNSQALEADALHFSTDILSSAVVFIGVLAVWLAEHFGLPEPWRSVIHQADTVAALVVALIIFRVSLTMCRSALDFLMDAAPEKTGDEIERAVLGVRGVVCLNRLRMRSSGPDYFADISVGVDPSLSVAQGHRIGNLVSEAVRRVLPTCDVLVHVDPRKAKHEEQGAFGLIEFMARKTELDVHSIRITRPLPPREGEKAPEIAVKEGEGGVSAVPMGDRSVHATAHVEFEGGTTFGQAYAKCRAFEAECAERDGDLSVFTHIEPRDSESLSRVLDPEAGGVAALVRERVLAAVAEEPMLANPHGLVTRMDETAGLVISFHCMTSAILSVSQVHDQTLRLERRLRRDLPEAGGIFIHMEPSEPGAAATGCLEKTRPQPVRRPEPAAGSETAASPGPAEQKG